MNSCAASCNGSSHAVAVLESVGVLVSATGEDSPQRRLTRAAPFFRSSNDRVTLSASGTVVAAEHDGSATGCVTLSIVTAASLLWPFITSCRDVSPRSLASLSDARLLPGTSLEVLLAGGGFPSWVTASLQGVFQVEGAVHTAAKMSSGQIPLVACGTAWKFGWRGGDGIAGEAGLPLTAHTSAHSIAANNYLPFGGVGHVAVLPWSLLYAAGETAHSCQAGDWVALSGSPFGALSPGMFFNTISIGIVSNTLVASDEASARPSLVAVDARCMPGQEGGPVVDRYGNLIGVVTLPMRLTAEGTELPLMLFVDSLRRTLIAGGALPSQSNPSLGKEPLKGRDGGECRPSWAASVVLIETENGWGTGVVMSAEGAVITNAHVVAGASRIRIMIKHPSGLKWYTARVIYAFKGPLDVAVLIPRQTLLGAVRAMELRKEAPEKGSGVIAIGYAMLSPRSRALSKHSTQAWAPSVHRGHLSQVRGAGLQSEAVLPAMLCSSATVHAGASGGPLLDEATLAVVGLITSNSHTSGGAVLPHLNYAIPACLLQKIWSLAQGGAESLTTANLQSVDAQTTVGELRRVWGQHSRM